MTFSPLRRLRMAALALFAVTAAGCASVPTMPAGLTDALGQVTGMSTQIADWKSTLTGALDQTGLGKLSDFATQAGDAGRTLTGFQDQVSGAMSDPLSAITGQLSQMSGLDVSNLQNLAPEAQTAAVDAFADQAGGVGTMVGDFLSQFSR